mgnify:CR=1 FL=1
MYSSRLGKHIANLYPLGVVHEAGEYDDAEDKEEDEEHELLGGGSKGLQQDLEAGGVAGQLEQPQYPDDAEELEDVGILDVGHQLLQDQVGVEAQRRHVVDHIDRGFEEIPLVRTGYEPKYLCYL